MYQYQLRNFHNDSIITHFSCYEDARNELLILGKNFCYIQRVFVKRNFQKQRKDFSKRKTKEKFFPKKKKERVVCFNCGDFDHSLEKCPEEDRISKRANRFLEEDIQEMGVFGLKHLLIINNLSTAGCKKVLRERLLEHLNLK